MHGKTSPVLHKGYEEYEAKKSVKEDDSEDDSNFANDNGCVIDFKDTLFTHYLTQRFEEVAKHYVKPAKALPHMVELLEELPPDNYYVLEWLVTRQIITCENCTVFARQLCIKPAALQLVIALADAIFHDSF